VLAQAQDPEGLALLSTRLCQRKCGTSGRTGGIKRPAGGRTLVALASKV
jgi:hypothetical protein